MSYLHCLRLLAHRGVQHIIVLRFYFVCLRSVYPMLSVSLDCSFLIAYSVFSNIYLGVNQIETRIAHQITYLRFYYDY